MTGKEFQKKYGIIGRSKEIKDLVDIIMQVAESDISVLITGSSGVGKEVFARAIHGYSKRKNKDLVSVNCGAIPEGILESELFGHKKGSFTGAVENRKGYFEIADGGTLFLDELAEMPLTTQVKLLRVLETGEIMPLGSEKVTKVNVRIIAATNKNLQTEVDSKRFRSDLYFRLKAVSLHIPELRKRPEDIPILANHFLLQYAENNKLGTLEISHDALDFLKNYSWPGNVRELKNVIESAAALTKSGILGVNDFAYLTEPQSFEESRFLPIHSNKSPETIDREIILKALIEIKNDLNQLKSMAAKAVVSEDVNYSRVENFSEVKSLAQLEKEAIRNALEFTKWNKRKAAKILGISERTLHRKIKEYEIYD